MFASIRAEIRRRGECRLGRRGTFWGRFSLGRWHWGAALCNFGDDGEAGHFALHLFCLWVMLWRAKSPPVDDMIDKWGVELHERSIYLSWGHRHKFIYLPWMYDHCRTEVMLQGGAFVPFERWTRGGEGPEPTALYRETFPYRYALRSGEIQERTATVTVERRSWCWRARPFRWLRWPRKVATSIDVQFSDEVGEGAGSWEGGVVATGHEMRPGETPEQCLRRMERERVFSR